MQENAAKCNVEANDETAPTANLTELQNSAIRLLLQGESICNVATAVGRDRTTVYRWLQEPKFIAERNRLAKEARESSRARLHSLARKAINVVEGRIDAGDLKAALAVLKFTGLAAGEKLDEETDEGRLISRMANELAESFCETFWMGESRKNLQKSPMYLEILHAFFMELERRYRTGESEAYRLQSAIEQRERAAAEAHQKIVKSLEKRGCSAVRLRKPETAVNGDNG